jgi:hypothetical protein
MGETSEAEQKTAHTLVPAQLSSQKSGLLNDFSNVTKFTVFFAFAIYTIGFIIWQSYLGNFGISLTSFLQTEYISAAFCYIIVFSCLAYPSLFIITHILLVLTKSNYGLLKAKKVSDTINIGMLVIFLLILIFIPLENIWKGFDTFPLNHFASGYVLSILVGFILAKLSKNKTKYRLLFGFYNTKILDVYFTILFILIIIVDKDIDKLFILYSLMAAALISLLSFKEAYKDLPTSHKVLYIFIISLAFLGNIIYFGKYQFQHIPKQVGGGRPETAFLEFSTEHKELAESINIPPSGTNNAGQLYGPVAILLRSDSEIIFININNSNRIVDSTSSISGTNAIAKEVQNNLVDAIIFER